MIERPFYLNQLIHSMNNGFVKIITGIRRCGKSYLLNEIFYNYLITHDVKKDHIIRFAFDSIDDLALIGENPLVLAKEKRKVDPMKFMDYLNNQVKDQDTYFILLDEVQELEAFETVLNACLRVSNYDVYVTGSNAKFLSKDIITQFAGRGDQIHLMPLSFKEFMSVYNGDKYEGLVEYMLYGGLPLVVNEKDPIKKRDILTSLFNEVYIKDIIQRNHIQNKNDLNDILNIISSSIGSLNNAEKIMNSLKSQRNSKIANQTVSLYLQYLEDSFLINSSYQYLIKGRKYIESPKKYYYVDMGLRNSRLNFRQFEQTHIMENVIYNELIHRGYNVDVGVVEINTIEDGKKVRKKLEIDFVCNLGEKRIYIQSAYSLPDEQKREQEIRPFMKTNDSFKKIVITKDMVPTYYDEHGIITMNIYDFLLNDNSLNQ